MLSEYGDFQIYYGLYMLMAVKEASLGSDLKVSHTVQRKILASESRTVPNAFLLDIYTSIYAFFFFTQ